MLINLAHTNAGKTAAMCPRLSPDLTPRPFFSSIPPPAPPSPAPSPPPSSSGNTHPLGRRMTRRPSVVNSAPAFCVQGGTGMNSQKSVMRLYTIRTPHIHYIKPLKRGFLRMCDMNRVSVVFLLRRDLDRRRRHHRRTRQYQLGAGCLCDDLHGTCELDAVASERGRAA